MKWFRNKEMLKDILEQNKNELEKYKNDKIVALLKDESNLIQDHLILLEENEKCKKIIDDLKLQNSNLKHSIDEKNEIIGDLEEEEKFKYTASFYMSKCEKFEKVIQIIKPLIKVQKSTMLDNVYWAYFGGGFQGIELTKEQYDLFQEVLEL